MAPASAAACLLATLLACAAAPAAAWNLGPWVDARATFYGRDPWALHTGSCGFGFICPNRWHGEGLASGYDVAALSDKSPLYKGGCGGCLEVACRSATIRDGSGNSYDRTGLCRTSGSVKVKIVDTCPCNYAGNADSNKRWCCGDFPHLDMSQWALSKITLETSRYGVFAIKYRTTPCDRPIANEAKQVGQLLTDPHANLKPAGLNCNSQGSLTTEAATKAHAITPKKKAPTPKKKAPTRSLKTRYRQHVQEVARKKKCDATCYYNMRLYFNHFDKNMKRYDGKPYEPFNYAGQK